MRTLYLHCIDAGVPFLYGVYQFLGLWYPDTCCRSPNILSPFGIVTGCRYLIVQGLDHTLQLNYAKEDYMRYRCHRIQTVSVTSALSVAKDFTLSTALTTGSHRLGSKGRPVRVSVRAFA